MHLHQLLLRALRRQLPVPGQQGWLFLGVLLAVCCSPLSAAEPQPSREQAARAIPLAELSPQGRAKVQRVLSNVSIYRRMPMTMIDCDPQMYLFLVEHPEVVVNIWELMGLSQMTLERTGPTTFAANDGQGTVGTVEVLYQADDMHLVYCNGYYEGPLLSRRINGSTLLLLKSEYARDADGRYHISCQLDAFINMDNAGVDLLSRALNPMLGHVADHNFRETARFLQTVSSTAETNAAGVERLSRKLERVQEPVRRQFAQVADEVAARADAAASLANRPTPQIFGGSAPRTAVQPAPNFRR